MSRFPKREAAALDHPAPGDEAALFVAVIGAAAKNVAALSDSALAIVDGAGEAYSQLVRAAAELFAARTAAVAALVAARTPGEVFAAQQGWARRAIDAYLAAAHRLGAVLTAGAKAWREPLLERLR